MADSSMLQAFTDFESALQYFPEASLKDMTTFFWEKFVMERDSFNNKNDQTRRKFVYTVPWICFGLIGCEKNRDAGRSFSESDVPTLTKRFQKFAEAILEDEKYEQNLQKKFFNEQKMRKLFEQKHFKQLMKNVEGSFKKEITHLVTAKK